MAEGFFSKLASAFGLSGEGSLRETDAAYADAESVRKEIHTVCHACIQACPCIAYVEDGVVVGLEGDPEGPANKGGMCLKGMAQLHTLYSPRHLLHPMKLVGLRGSNEWEQITWDEALDMVSTHIATTIEKYGSYSTWAAAGGGGNYVSALSAGWPYAYGCTSQMSPGAIQCYLPRSCMAGIMWGGDNQSAADCSLLEIYNDHCPSMEVLVIWGGQPSVSQTAQSGHGMADARVDRGTKTIVIDPYMTPDAAKATVWLPIRPGSDTALILAWIRYIIENGLYDEEFCQYWTNLPFLINPDTKIPYLAEEMWPDYVNPAIDPDDVFETPAYVCFDKRAGSLAPFPFTAPADSPVDPELFATVEIDGKVAKTAFQIYREGADEWTLERAAEVCWLDAGKIEDAVKLYASAKNGGILNGVFSDMQECASSAPLGMLGLDMMMGFVNKPGCALTGKGPGSRSKTRAIGPKNLAPISYQNSHHRYGLGWTIGWTKSQNDKYLNERKEKFREQGRDPDYMQKHMAECLKERLGGVEHKGAYWWNQTTNPAIRDAIDTGEPYKPRCLYYFSGNLLCNVGEPVKWHQSLLSQDFICQQYSNMTSFTVELADLFLPTVEWLEYDNAVMLVQQVNKKFIRRKAVHLGETLPPEMPAVLAINRVCDKLGGRDKVFDPDFFAAVAGGYDDSDKKHAIWAKIDGAPSWDELMEHQSDYLPKVMPPEEYWQYYQHEDIATDGLPVGFGTESRKCEPYCTCLVKMARTGYPFLYPFETKACADYDPICTYVDQTENPMNDAEYPLVMTSGRIHHYHHGTLRHSAFNRELMPYPEMQVNPKTAREYGIENGDWVRITSRRSSTHGVACLTEGIAPGVLWMERFWNPECFDSTQETITGGWQECNVATLTYDGVLNDVFGSATYRAFQVKIEKSSKPDRIWVEPREFEPFLPTLKAEPQTKELY